MTIERKHTGARMSQVVIHGDTVYLAGQVAEDAPGEPAGAQMRDILERVERMLADAGTDKTKLLSATIWLADMRDFDAINEVWDAWVPEGHAPARACGEAKLAKTKFTVELSKEYSAVMLNSQRLLSGSTLRGNRFQPITGIRANNPE